MAPGGQVPARHRTWGLSTSKGTSEGWHQGPGVAANVEIQGPSERTVSPRRLSEGGKG